MTDNLVLYVAEYSTLEAAEADLNAIEQLHKDDLVGLYDAAVIDKKDGKAHIAKRKDRPRIQVVPEMFGGGKLPRKELKEAAAELIADEAGLIVVAEPTFEKAFDKAVSSGAKIVKRAFDADLNDISKELQEALKS